MKSLTRTVAIVTALVLAIGSASANPFPKIHFTGPGWYVVEDNPGGELFIFGPYADEPACLAVKPPDEEWAIFRCEGFQEKPYWDR